MSISHEPAGTKIACGPFWHDSNGLWVSATADTNMVQTNFATKPFQFFTFCHTLPTHYRWVTIVHSDNNPSPVAIPQKIVNNVTSEFTVSLPMLNNVFKYFAPLSAKCVGLQKWCRWVSHEESISQNDWIFIWCSLWCVSVCCFLHFIESLLANSLRDTLKLLLKGTVSSVVFSLLRGLLHRKNKLLLSSPAFVRILPPIQ